ncbi:MAG TPA: lipopolysaccharide biosynthesis protein [Candidatus Binatia bacterium]|nr:lipopolysaccharide biosynthesis protein [Candidatus Binatia bacterium]
MAIRHIPNREEPLSDADLERALTLQAEEPRVRRQRRIARLTLLWQHRLELRRWAVAGLVACVVLVFLLPVRYASTTRLMPPDQGAGAGMAAVLASFSGKSGGGGGDLGVLPDLLGLKTSADLFIGVLKSRTIQDAIINKFDLRKEYSLKRWEDTRKELEKRTDLSTERKSGIITIAVSDRDPARAQAITEEYVEQLDKVVTSLNNSSAHKERVFLEQRLTEVNQDLEKSEQQFSEFAGKNTVIDLKEQGNAMLQAAASVEGQLIAAQTELQGLRALYTDNNVRVRETEARIEELRKQLKKLGGSAPPAGSSAPVANESDDYPAIRQLPALGVPYTDLYRRVKVEEAVFETLTKQYELAKLEEAKETLSVKVLDPANIPEKRSFPPRILFVGLGELLTLGLAVLWIQGREKWRNTSTNDPGKALAMEVFNSARHTLSSQRRRNGTSGK